MTTAEAQLARVRTALDCLDARDAEGFLNLFSDDVEFQLGGFSPFSGAYRGRDTVRALVDGFVSLMGPSFRMVPVDVLADDRYIAMMFHTTGERDGKVLDVVTGCFAAAGDDGRWTRCWWVPSDQQAYDTFFS